MIITQQSIANMEYVRRLLRENERGFSAALELAVLAVEQELASAATGRERLTAQVCLAVGGKPRQRLAQRVE
jgi:hypothetical protein